MNDFTQTLVMSFSLIGRLDPELVEIVGLSLRISLTASIIALIIGAPIGACLAIARFPGRLLLTGMVNAPLVMPEIITGISMLLMFSRCRLSLGAKHSASFNLRRWPAVNPSWPQRQAA